MAKLNSMLRHAITPPAFDRTKLHRERLVDTIHANIPRKLIVIAAPAGYGKTTLLADFTNHTELPVCWVRLSEADRDVVRLANVLAFSLQRRFRRLQRQLDLERLAISSPRAIARAFSETIDAFVSETFVIALDDVHLINRSRAVLEFLDAFLEEQPEQVTLIAAGREVLEVSLARLMAESDLTGLGPHDLALTKPELFQLAEVRTQLKISEQDVDRLQEETRGWITGVLLSTELSSNGLNGLLPDSRPMVYEYLASVVLNRQADDMRRFMLDTSVFPIMTAEGCDHLRERDDSQRFLSRLIRGGLFVTATEDGPKTYEYHPQFREFLLETLRNSDRRRHNALLIRAADLLAKQGLPEHAVDLYCNAGASRRAATLAEKCAQEVFRRGRWRTLESWANKLEDAQSPAPKVFLYLAANYNDQGNIDLAEKSLIRAREMITPKVSNSTKAYAEIVRGHIDRRRGRHDEALLAAERAESILSPRGSLKRKADCYRLRALATAGNGDLHSAEAFALKAVELLERTNSKYALAAALVDLSNCKSALGKAREAHVTATRAHSILEEAGSPYSLAVSFTNLAYDAHLQGRYEEALELFNEGLKCARQAATKASEANILFSQADLFADLDLALQAAELYGQGLNLAISVENLDLIRYGCIQTSVLHRRRGGSGLAHEWLRRAMELGESESPPVFVTIQKATLEASAKPKKARDTLSRLLDQKEALTAKDRTLALIFLARSEFSFGDLDASQVALEEALDWAGANGTEQILAGELTFDADFRDFARHRLSGHPVLAVVLRRIETMRAVSQQYKDVSSETDSGARITLISLGESSILQADKPIIDLKPLAREVLFYLIDHKRVDRDILLETFWPHHPPGRQVANLHTAIYSQRRALGRDLILHEGNFYSINPDIRVEYDVDRFERAASIAEGLPPGDPRRMFALTEAINSYGGLFLLDLNSDWVLERRRTLEVHYLDLLAQHAEEALVRDQPLRAVSTLRQALQIDPYRDDTNMRFLEALGRLGRRSEMVAHYQRYVRLLADELGLDPPQPIRELYTRLID